MPVKPEDTLDLMVNNNSPAFKQSPPLAVRAGGLQVQGPRVAYLNYIFWLFSVWLRYLNLFLHEKTGSFSKSLPANPSRKVYINESETITEPIVIRQDDTLIEFAPGVTVTADKDVVSKMIIIRANRVTIRGARLGWSSSVGPGDDNYPLFIEEGFNHCILSDSRIFNYTLPGISNDSKRIKENGVIVE